MLYNLLQQYIEYKLYASIDEVHEKIVVHYATGDLTDGEYMTLFNMLFPIVEETQSEIATLDEVEKELRPMPKKALDIITKMSNANILEDEKHKLDTYVQLGQMTKEQYAELTHEPMQDIPTILPEIEDVPTILPEIEQEEIAVASLSIENVGEETTAKPKARKKKKKKTT